MESKEMSEEVRALEAQITDLLKGFTEKTNALVRHIDIDITDLRSHEDSYRGKHPIAYTVQVEAIIGRQTYVV